MMEAESKTMLLELADLLDVLPDERFDYNTWVGDDWKGAEDLSCGTSACAAGWATTLPSFRARGLRLHTEDFSVNQIDLTTGDEMWNGFLALGSVLHTSYEDAKELFMAYTWSDRLQEFSPRSGATASEVATWIRRWVAAS